MSLPTALHPTMSVRTAADTEDFVVQLRWYHQRCIVRRSQRIIGLRRKTREIKNPSTLADNTITLGIEHFVLTDRIDARHRIVRNAFDKQRDILIERVKCFIGIRMNCTDMSEAKRISTSKELTMFPKDFTATHFLTPLLLNKNCKLS